MDGQEASVFSCYRALIRLRREYAVLTEGEYELLLPEDEEVFAYARTSPDGRMLVICHFYGGTIGDPLAAEQLRGVRVLDNYADGGQPGTLRPYEARMVWFPAEGEGK